MRRGRVRLRADARRSPEVASDAVGLGIEFVGRRLDSMVRRVVRRVRRRGARDVVRHASVEQLAERGTGRPDDDEHRGD